MATLKKLKVLLGYNRMTDAVLVQELNTIHDALTGNPHYTNAPVDLVVFKTGTDTFSALIIEAADGSKKAISAKNKQREVMIRMVTKLAHYVEDNSNDDPAIFSTSGFVASTGTRITPQPLEPAGIEWIDRGAISGQAVVKIKTVPSAASYEVQYAVVGADGKPGTWTTAAFAGSKKTAIDGLTPGAAYVFQARALGQLGFTDWSDSTTFICA